MEHSKVELNAIGSYLYRFECIGLSTYAQANRSEARGMFHILKNIVKYEVSGYFRILEKCLLRSQQVQGTDCWSSWARPCFGARPELATDLATSVDKDLPPDSAESTYTVYTPGV